MHAVGFRLDTCCHVVVPAAAWCACKLQVLEPLVATGCYLVVIGKDKACCCFGASVPGPAQRRCAAVCTLGSGLMGAIYNYCSLGVPVAMAAATMKAPPRSHDPSKCTGVIIPYPCLVMQW